VVSNAGLSVILEKKFSIYFDIMIEK